MNYEFFQQYWWLLDSVLGALLVFLLFVQGGQSLLFFTQVPDDRNLIVNSVGRKWELSFTMLVVFGGAFFASFPLFYSTSFGGAYWLWILILLGFVAQAVSYEFRRRRGNVYGTLTYDLMLSAHGVVSTVLLGVAVATFFFGAEFRVEKIGLLDASAPAVSTWSASHGLEAILDWRNLTLGVAVLFLSRVQAALYMMKTVDAGKRFFDWCRRQVLVNSVLFLVFFLTFAALLLTATGYRPVSLSEVEEVPYKYLFNFLDMWWVLLTFLAGVVMVLAAIGLSVFRRRFTNGIWLSGAGTVLVVLALFWVAGYNGTAYYPSLLDANSSLTIYNSSSSEFTLRTMSYVSLIIPFVAAYIIYAWWSLTRTPLTNEEISQPGHKY